MVCKAPSVGQGCSQDLGIRHMTYKGPGWGVRNSGHAVSSCDGGVRDESGEEGASVLHSHVEVSEEGGVRWWRQGRVLGAVLVQDLGGRLEGLGWVLVGSCHSLPGGGGAAGERGLRGVSFECGGEEGG